MSEEKNVPKLRFPGFTEPWEQRKLGEVATFINGRAYSQDELLDEGKYKVLRVGNFYTNDSWYYSDLELPDKFYAQEGDLLYTWSATFGPHIWHGNKVIYHYHIWKVELSDKLDKTFTLQLLEEDKANILANKNGSTMVHITKEGMEQKQISIPSSVQEQAQIGAYFEQLDNLITLHQRKLGHVKDLKKSMLQKMFPKNGELYPEVRFPGFTAAWEQRKLGEVLESMQNNTLSRAELSNEQGSVMNVHYGDVLVKFGEVLNVSEEQLPMIADDIIVEKYKSSFLQNGDVIIADTAEDETVGKCTEIANLQEKAVVSGLHTIPYRPLFKFASGYLGYYMNSAAYHNQLLPLMQGIKVTSISKSSMQNTDIVYPKSVNEQKQIGDYFCKLDRLITLHQRELDHLQLLKKGMLQQMFV